MKSLPSLLVPLNQSIEAGCTVNCGQTINAEEKRIRKYLIESVVYNGLYERNLIHHVIGAVPSERVLRA